MHTNTHVVRELTQRVNVHTHTHTRTHVVRELSQRVNIVTQSQHGYMCYVAPQAITV